MSTLPISLPVINHYDPAFDPVVVCAICGKSKQLNFKTVEEMFLSGWLKCCERTMEIKNANERTN